MGNCQATEAATVIIHHPEGKVERIYWSVTASQVMDANPGHYVAIIITTNKNYISSSSHHHSRESINSSSNGSAVVKVKHYLKLLRPDDTLHIGHVYRLVSFEDVLREFATKKYVRLSRLVGKQRALENAKKRRSVSGSCTVGGVTVSSPIPCRDVEHDRQLTGDTTATTPVTDHMEQQHQRQDEGEKQLDSELEEEVQGMVMAGDPLSIFGGGAPQPLIRHGQWRPALQSIPEVEVRSQIYSTKSQLNMDDRL